MNADQFRADIREIQQQIEEFQHSQASVIWDDSTAMLENLKTIYEEMRTSLMFASAIETKLLQQNQLLTLASQHYQGLFQGAPIAQLVTDAHGVILEGNEAIAHLLNVPCCYLTGKPLAIFVASADRQAFRTAFTHLASAHDTQTWRLSLCPRGGSPFEVALHVAIARSSSGDIKVLHIAVYDLRPMQQTINQAAQSLSQQATNGYPPSPSLTHPPTHSPSPSAPQPTTSSLPPSLDGLHVLIVDDEADAREFITTVLESYGICVTAVATVDEALEALEYARPDVLISDIRMPGSNGYDLIRVIREMEQQWDVRIPAAALSAYQEENHEKALRAGFEMYLSKLSNPDDFVTMIARLAGRISR